MPDKKLPTPNSQLPTSDFQLRSEEVQEILTKVPHWMIRWGNLVVLFILLSLFLLSWIVKYPDIISTQIVITTEVPPQKLVSKTSGKIEAILVADKSDVSENMPLAIIENSANYKDVFKLKSSVDNNKTGENFNFSELQNLQLGDLETTFAMFQKEYSTNQLNQNLQPFKVDGNAHSLEAIQLKERLNLLESQKSINLSELELSKKDFERYQNLFNKGIISSQELEKHQMEKLQADKNYKNLLSSISSLKSSLNELNRSSKVTSINENKENSNLDRNVLQSYFQLKKALKDWELNFVLRSSINGKVSFLQIWTSNQTINSGDTIFSIIPNEKSKFIGKLKAPVLNSGKIKLGQNVNIRLTNYPDREFGILQGKIKNISLTPDKDNNLLIDVSLPNGLLSSYKKQLTYQPEMSGNADIVTEDLRLLERLLYQFRDIFKR